MRKQIAKQENIAS